MQTKRKNDDGISKNMNKVTKKLKKSTESDEMKKNEGLDEKTIDTSFDSYSSTEKKAVKPSPIRTSARISQKLKCKDPKQISSSNENINVEYMHDKHAQVEVKGSNIFSGSTIVYAHLPSGEIVGNFVNKPINNLGKSKNIPNANDPVKENSIVTSKTTNSVIQVLPTSLLNNKSNDCPIDEFNVEEVLHTSIRATHSMRIFLSSIRDGLKRMASSAGPNAVITIEQLKKRKDLADKLHGAYNGYKQAISSEFLITDKHNTSPSKRTGKTKCKEIFCTKKNNKQPEQSDVIELSEESDVEE